MSERFIRLYELQNNLYSAGSPVIVSAGALLKDTQTNNIIVQLKFHSVSVTPIKALKVGIAAFDIAGKGIEGVDEYQYLDLNIQNGQEFGSNKAIVMPDAVTRSFSVRNITVVLANGNVQDVSMPMITLPKIISLQSELKDAELVKQYKLAVNDKSAYIPQETDDLWMCSCGEWNSGDFCTRCRAKRTVVFSAYDIPALTDKMTSRLATERAQREEQQRLAEIERQRKAEQDRIAVEEAAKRKAAEAEKRKKAAKKVKIAAAIIAPIIALVFLLSLWVYPNMIQPSIAYKDAEQLLNNGQYEEAIAAFQALGDYKDSSERIEEAKEAINVHAYVEAEQLLLSGEYDAAIAAFQALGNYKDSLEKIAEVEEAKKATEYQEAEAFLALGDNASSAITFGKLGDYRDAHARSIELWGDLAERKTIVAGNHYIVGLKSDGTVIAVGENNNGQCEVGGWTDIVAISADDNHTVGLKSNGTVVATGCNDFGKCDVNAWTDIVAISAGDTHTVGLKSDGTVVATGGNAFGECNVSTWKNIIAISAGSNYTVGLRSNGSVIFTGWDQFGIRDALKWADIIAISASSDSVDNCIVGVKSDGTVVTTDHDVSSQLVSEWTDIIEVSASADYAVGLKSDGTVVSAGDGLFGQRDVDAWEDIVAISAGWHCTVGLKSDGTVVITGKYDSGQCNVEDWTDIRVPTSRARLNE